MALLNDIVDWATTSLPAWQQDALRRLFQKQSLDSQDFDDLYGMLKGAYGVADPLNRTPVPLSEEHLPALVDNATIAILLEMGDLKHVNQIASAQKILFAHKGLTIIYGANGSGKSGYSRVLKRACRSRDMQEVIHPNAYDENELKCILEATFRVAVDGQEKEPFTWKHNENGPKLLSTISVFDGRCARIYLDTEQDAAYLPFGLDIIQNLGQKVLPELAGRLEKDVESINVDKKPFDDLLGDTEVGKIIGVLNENTDQGKLKKLGTFDEAESGRLIELKKLLSENDPAKKAKEIRLKIQRIEGHISRIDSALKNVGDEATGRLKTGDIELETALKAVSIAAEDLRKGESLLPGTGEDVWRALFCAARRFSAEVAYSGKPFPCTETSAQCPLCQQTLDQDAKQRLMRFDEYLKQETAKIASEKRNKHEANVAEFKKIDLAFGVVNALADELTQLDPNLFEDIKKLEGTVLEWKEWVLKALADHNWSDPIPFPGEKWRTSLKEHVRIFSEQAGEFERATIAENQKTNEHEHMELHARDKLKQRLQAVIDLHGRFRQKAMLTKCKGDINTRRISDKAKEFANKTVTEALKEALNDEFKELGVGHVKIKLADMGKKGTTKHKLVLDLPESKSLKEILSDGEQRIIAIGSFMAELRLSGHKGGIVFDDPVSSLDHHHRKNIALRLVKEAAQRQVIIFTHDTVFLAELRDAVEQKEVEHKIHFLEWRGDRSGHVEEGLPWEHKSCGDRLDKLEKEQRALQSAWPPYPGEVEREKMRHQYSHLRATLERAIQDVIFNGVIHRYRDYINVRNLDKAVGFTVDECNEITRLYKAYCDETEAHDKAPAKDAPVPTPEQLGKHIADLKNVVDKIQTRKKEGSAK